MKKAKKKARARRGKRPMPAWYEAEQARKLTAGC